MRNSRGLVTSALLVLWVTTPMAMSLPYTGKLVVNVGEIDPLEVPGSGGGVSAPGTVGIGPGANFTTAADFPITLFSSGSGLLNKIQIRGPAAH